MRNGVFNVNSMQMIRSESPETLNTMTSHQTVPFGAVVIDTRWATHAHSFRFTLNTYRHIHMCHNTISIVINKCLLSIELNSDGVRVNSFHIITV